jgi:5-histidylcysteine sulfoxide synthase/putative 4-mercaptohistidine N1-methyltranferase
MLQEQSVKGSSEAPWRCNLGRESVDWLSGPRPEWWFSGGLAFDRAAAGLGPDGALASLPQLRLDTCTRETVRAYFENTWWLTELLFSALASEEAFYQPPYHGLRHPMIFYFCHPAVLYVNKLRVVGFLDGPVNATFENLFETGVDEMSWDDMSKNEQLWPTLSEAIAYRKQVYALVQAAIAQAPELDVTPRPFRREGVLWALAMGFEHERIHLETSSVLIRELPLAHIQRPVGWVANHPSSLTDSAELPEAGCDYPVPGALAVAPGEVVIGKPSEYPSFGWDNTRGDRVTQVRAFEADRYLVSNGAYHAFVRAGGYREQSYWSEAGWAWRTFRNAKWPCFWVPDGPAGLLRFRLRTCFETTAMPWSWPVEVNWYEAQAYANWCAAETGQAWRLLTEAEHHRLRDDRHTGRAGMAAEDPVLTLDGRAMAHQGLNLNLAYATPMPVDAGVPSQKGFYDVFGNVWQWMGDHFHPLPGFKQDVLYEDFSQPCFDGRHQMILGGSFISTGEEASIWARYHFRPHFLQHAGFRLGRLASGEAGSDAVLLHGIGAGSGVYESDQTLNEYMVLHYGLPEDVMPYAFGPKDAVNFPVRCAQLVNDVARELAIPMHRALDVGCAVGGAVFELATAFDEVVGVDLSQAFIEAAEILRRNGRMPYWLKQEGEIGEAREAMIQPASLRERVAFRVDDACNLSADLEGFDAVLMANLLCRLPEPQAAIARLTGHRALVRPGGLLVLISPYTWLDAFTPRQAWLGARYQDGVALRSQDAIKTALSPAFTLVREADVPLVIREHHRKFQYIVSHAMVWQRR